MFYPDISHRGLGLTFENGRGEFRFWAPKAKAVCFYNLTTGDVLPMEREDEQYFSLVHESLQKGILYRVQIDEGDHLPDPVSLYQPEGVHGPSQAADLSAFTWHDHSWENPALDKYIIYELHTGAFSAGSNFDGIAERIHYLVSLGITAIELMPIGQFPGNRNWGYDGVYPFAVQNSYGGPEGLLNLVDRCHQAGLAVILDVVYNHLGPEGNYLPASGPWFTDKYKTPWGEALNFDDAWSDGVRGYFLENILMWFRDYHIDGLRMDAVHAIKDLGAVHFLQETSMLVKRLEAESGRSHHLIIECDLNDPRYIEPADRGGYGIDATWSDEFHHALRVCAGLDKTGYYSDFHGLKDLAKVWQDGYVYTGQYSEHRKRRFGKMPASGDGSRFVVFSQNHDQVGNRMLGERSADLHGAELARLLAAAVILSPFVPLLFMGEEYGETRPFLYFVSHGDEELNEMVRKGRREEFSAFHSGDETPDPASEETFEKSRLVFPAAENEQGLGMFRYYQKLIELRKTEPALARLSMDSEVSYQGLPEGVLHVSRRQLGETIHLVFNFSDRDLHPEIQLEHNARLLIDSADPAWSSGASAREREIHSVWQLAPRSVLIIKENHAQ